MEMKEETPKEEPEIEITDEELISLFSHIKPLHDLVGLCPPTVSLKHPSGILKTDKQIREEKSKIGLKGALVVCVGPNVQYVKVGQRVFINNAYSEYPVAFSFEKEDNVILGYNESMLACTVEEKVEALDITPDPPPTIRDLVK